MLPNSVSRISNQPRISSKIVCSSEGEIMVSLYSLMSKKLYEGAEPLNFYQPKLNRVIDAEGYSTELNGQYRQTVSSEFHCSKPVKTAFADIKRIGSRHKATSVPSTNYNSWNSCSWRIC